MKFNLAKNLRNLMECSGLGESALAKDIGIKQPLVHRILSGENTNPTLATLQIIAKYFSITISQLIGEDPLAASVNNTISSDLNNWHRVPLIQESHLLQNIADDKKEEAIMIDHVLSEKAFAIQYTHNNMSPAIPEKSIVVIDPYILPSHKDFVFLQNSQNFLIKTYIKKGNDKLLLTFLNNFDTIELLSSDDHILGTVVRVIYGRQAI